MKTKVDNNTRKKAYAWGVHVFTATGAVWGLLSVIAIFNHAWREAIVWMMVAMFVDSFDGMLARKFEVKKLVPEVDGGLLDNIIDYLNYVFVPALFLIEATQLLPDSLRYVGAFSILLTSAFQFTQVDAKNDGSDEFFFKGFPSYWNALVIYLLVLKFNAWINLAIIVLCNILVFVPIKYLYPSRDKRAKRATMIFTYLFGIIGAWGMLQYPDVPQWVILFSFVYIGYYLALSILPRKSKTPK